MSEPHICSLSGSSSDHVSVCLSDQMEHNGHAQRKKHVVELYCFVAHAQHNTSRTIEEGEALGKKANSVHIAGLNVTENQQDSKTEKTVVETWWQRVGKVQARRAREGSEQRARRLEGS